MKLSQYPEEDLGQLVHDVVPQRCIYIIYILYYYNSGGHMLLNLEYVEQLKHNLLMIANHPIDSDAAPGRG